VLADFRAWLLEAAALPADNGEGGPAPDGAVPVDLHTLLGQFVALRHEVNLQTRASRAQQEQTDGALRQLAQALDLLQQRQEAPARPADSEEALRPLLKTLLDLHDALSLAGREVQRVESALLPALDQLTADAGPPPGPPAPADVALPFWLRLLGGGRAVREALTAGQRQAAGTAPQEARRQQAGQAAGRVRQFVTSVVTGYTMSVQRLERALPQYGLEPIPCVGRPFDPEVMEAIEVVAEPGRSSTEVIEEVRRGYLWRGRVLRYAQVKVSRPEK
jgi:molecular chaperone GrpE